jgi:hypothetical protein
MELAASIAAIGCERQAGARSSGQRIRLGPEPHFPDAGALLRPHPHSRYGARTVESRTAGAPAINAYPRGAPSSGFGLSYIGRVE